MNEQRSIQTVWCAKEDMYHRFMVAYRAFTVAYRAFMVAYRGSTESSEIQSWLESPQWLWLISGHRPARLPMQSSCQLHWGSVRGCSELANKLLENLGCKICIHTEPSTLIWWGWSDSTYSACMYEDESEGNPNGECHVGHFDTCMCNFIYMLYGTLRSIHLLMNPAELRLLVSWHMWAYVKTRYFPCMCGLHWPCSSQDRQQGHELHHSHVNGSN